MSGQPRLQGRVAFITGASRGIGKAVALAYAEEGADLMLLARQAGLLEAVADAARAKGVQALTFSADITDAEQVEAAMEVTERRYGRIDVLVNNAGIYRGAKFVDYDLETWNRVLQVNVNGTFICTQAALKRMVPRRSGKIVMMASTAGKYGSLYQAAYNASKHAVVGMTRCLALETAKQGITVNAICPGFVETDMIEALIPNAMKNAGIEDRQGMTQALLQRVPIGRFLQPEEIAHLAVYLASSESDGMTGQALTISGGLILV